MNRPSAPEVLADLNGTWRTHASVHELGREFWAAGFDDSTWPTLAVPGHWRACPDLADSDGPVLMRRAFTTDSLDPTRRAFLEIDGAFYYTDVWLDAAYLGATEGYFERHTFEVTDQLRESRDHELAVEVACPPQTDAAAKRIVTGVFSHWDDLDPGWNPGGLWRPVRVRATGAVRIERSRVVCVEAGETRGRIALDLTLDSDGLDDDLGAAVDVTVVGPDGEPLAEQLSALTLSVGRSRHRLEVLVENPPLWWPHRLGDAPMCTVEVAVVHRGTTSDQFSAPTAFREVRMRKMVLAVNGERIFTMGASQGPTRMALAEATDREIAGDVELALRANLDLLRVHGHVARPELYDAADRAGLMLWQDLPLQWGYSHSVRRQATHQAAAMVDHLAHHPSIVCWCGHDEPVPARRPGSGAAAATLPSWNRDVLDRAVHRSIHRADSTRPVLAHSGVNPGPASGGTDTHLSFGWRYDRASDMADWLRRWPRLARWVSEFGAQSVPHDAAFLEASRWPDLDWPTLAQHHALDHELLVQHVPVEAFPDATSWIEATQTYQAALVQLQVEDLRRLKFRPTGGFCHSRFADAYPAVTRGVLDHRRRPKAAYAALRDACRPVLPTVDPRDGSIHVVNELRVPLRGAAIAVTVAGRLRRFAGDADADATTFVGRVDLDECEQLEIELLHSASGPVVNRYGATFLALGRAAGS